MADDDYKRTIYVGNLPDDITSEALYAFFVTFGQIKSIEIPRDHITNSFRGFAFIQFDEKQDAISAIDNYDKTEFMGRTIKVRKSKPLDLKPNYHKPVWANDDWLQKIQQRKIQTQRITKQQEQKNKALGLPIYKLVEAKDQQKPIVVYIEQQDV